MVFSIIITMLSDGFLQGNESDRDFAVPSECTTDESLHGDETATDLTAPYAHDVVLVVVLSVESEVAWLPCCSDAVSDFLLLRAGSRSSMMTRMMMSVIIR